MDESTDGSSMRGIGDDIAAETGYAVALRIGKLIVWIQTALGAWRAQSFIKQDKNNYNYLGESYES